MESRREPKANRQGKVNRDSQNKLYVFSDIQEATTLLIKFLIVIHMENMQLSANVRIL